MKEITSLAVAKQEFDKLYGKEARKGMWYYRITKDSIEMQIPANATFNESTYIPNQCYRTTDLELAKMLFLEDIIKQGAV